MSDAGGRRHYTRLGKHFATYGVGAVVNRLAGFLLLPVYTRVIPGDEIGILWLMVATGAFLTTLLSMGMQSASLRYHALADSGTARAHVISTWMRFAALFPASVLVCLFLAREPLAQLLTGSPDHAGIFSILLISLFWEQVLYVPMGILRAEQRSRAFTVLAVTRFLIQVVVAIVLVVVLRQGVAGVLTAIAVTNALMAVICARIAWPAMRHGFSPRLLRNMLRFGAPIMVATLGAMLIDASDLWILSGFRGIEEVSQYGTAYRIVKILHVLTIQPFLLAWPTFMWTLVKQRDDHVVLARTLTFTMAGISWLALAFSLFRRELLVIVTTAEFLPAAPIMPWVLFGLVFLLSSYIVNTGISISGRTELVTVAMAISVVVNIGLNLLFVPEHGMIAAAISTFVAYVVLAVTTAALSHRQHPIPFEWGRLARVGALAGACLAAGLAAESLGGIASFAARLLVCVVFAAAILSPLVMREAERRGLVDIIRSVPRYLERSR